MSRHAEDTDLVRWCEIWQMVDPGTLDARISKRVTPQACEIDDGAGI